MTTASTPPIGIENLTLSAQTIAGRRRRVAMSDLATFFAEAIPAVAAELGRAGITPAGPPIAAYSQEQGDTFEVTVGFPVTRPPATDNLVKMQLPGGKAVRAMHVGAYRTLPETYGRLGEWFADRHQQPPSLMWEEYLVGPDAGGEAGCMTRVVFPLS